MAKDAYYFSHDSNARNDPKTSALIAEYGMEGYGFYWAFIEILSEQNEYKIKKFPKLYQSIGKQCSSDASKAQSMIEAMVNDYELLMEDENFIWSKSLLKRMEEKEKKRQLKVESGRKGGIKSGETRKKEETNEATLKQNEAVVEANEPKESKVKESKGKENKVVVIPPEKNTTTTTIVPEKFYSENFQPITPYISEQIQDFITEYSLSDDFIVRIMQMAIDNGKKSWGYCSAILKQKISEGIKTVESLEYHEKKRKEKDKPKTTFEERYPNLVI